MNGLSQSRVRGLVALATLCLVASTAYGGPTSLSNGVPITGISGAAGSEQFYMIVVPSGQDELEIQISGGTGDCDLYVRKDTEPTTTTYDYRPYKVGNNETVLVESPAAGTWYIMLRGYSAFSGLTLQALYSASLSVVTLSNGVPLTGLSDAAGGEKYYQIEVPSGQTKLQISISGGTGDCDLYVKRGALPTTTDYDYRPFLSGNNESVSVDNPTAGTWYIMLHSYSAYSGLTLLASYTGGGIGTLLSNGVPVTGLAGAENSARIFSIEVPSGETSLQIKISGGTGDCDLYVKFGAVPTISDYDYRPFLSGNDETVSVNNPTGGTWYIMLQGSDAYSGVTLVATYGKETVLEDNVPVYGIAGAGGSEQIYKIDIPSGQSGLEIKIFGGTGNCDLYVRWEAIPSTSNWDYRPYLSGNDETVTIENPEGGTWYIMLRGRTAYADVTLNADYWFSGAVTLLDNGVPVTNISGLEGSEAFYRIIVPTGQTKFEIKMSGGTGDADLYVKRNAPPTTSDYDYRPYQIGNNETVTIDNPQGGNWLIMIRGYHAYAGVTLVATFGTSGGETVTELTNGVPVTGLSGASSSEAYYKIDVPAGQASLVIQISGGTGDVDLYVRRGSKPTTTEWDYRPYLIGNEETVTINSPTSGAYYIMLRGYQAYTGLTLVATYVPSSAPVIALTNSVPLSGLSDTGGGEKFYLILVPAGQDFLNISISGGTGDCDLYVKRGSQPTTTSYDYRPYLVGNEESVEIAHPAAANWYIMLKAHQVYSGVTLMASYGAIGTGNNFAGDVHCAAVWRFEDGQLGTDSVGTNVLFNYGVEASTTDYMEGAGAGEFRKDQEDWMSVDDDDLSATFPTRSDDADVEMSICFWMKARSFAYENTVISKYLISTDDRSWRIYVGNFGVSTGVLYVGLGTGLGDMFDTYAFDAMDQRLSVDHWYHVAFTYRDADRSYHVRVWDATAGVLTFDVVGTAQERLAINNAPVVLGNLPLESRHFDGWLDEVVVFDDILTTAEIDLIRQGAYGKL